MEKNHEILSQNPPALHSPEKQGSSQKNPFKLATIICAVLALAGIGFGIYEYLQNGDKAVKISELSAKLDLIKTETNTELVDKEEDGTTRTYVEPATEAPASSNSSFRNAIISNNRLTMIFESDDDYTEQRSVHIYTSNGEISACNILKARDDGYGKQNVGDCQITGISGKISAISQIGNTQMSWPYLGFLLEDGSVEYISAFELTENFSTSVKGKLKFEFKKPVTNIVNNIVVSDSEGVGGYRTTAFYHDDGSISIFSDSLLTE